jgi:TonB family protein
MHETHERTRMMSLRLPRAWFARAVVVLALVSCHVVLFYGISQTRALKSSADGPPMFGPVVLNKWRDLHQRYVTSRPSSEPMQEDQSIPPSRHWKFPPIDIWPSSASRPATLSRFTPVTDAQPDPTDTLTAQEGIANKPPVRLSTLRMVRWLRPDYPIEWAVAGMDGSVLLDQRIDAHGQPVRTNVARSSGSPQLDEAALHAANAWRFAPPLWKSQAVEVLSQIEVRFNFFDFQFSRIDESHTDTSPEEADSPDRAGRVSSWERSVRRLVGRLQSPQTPAASDLPTGPELQSLTAAVRGWGPVQGVKYVGLVGQPEWRTYAIKPDYLSDSPSGSVTVRWELYRVEHERSTSLWKIACDFPSEYRQLHASPLPALGARRRSGNARRIVSRYARPERRHTPLFKVNAKPPYPTVSTKEIADILSSSLRSIRTNPAGPNTAASRLMESRAMNSQLST